jgi:hypothetical protein
MLAIFIISMLTWVVATGGIVVLCAITFLDIHPSSSKVLVALIAGPFAINKEWWLHDKT